MARYEVIFRKADAARFLSHLDLMATFEYAVRRARLPFELSEGFNPRPRISAAAPLALGHVGEREILEIALREPLSPLDVKDRLQGAVPPGIRILQVEAVPAGRKPAAARLRSAVYRVALPHPEPEMESRVSALLDRSALPIEEKREAGVRRRDVRPLILSLHAEDEAVLRLTVRLDSAGSVRAEQVLQLLSLPLEGARITRERIELAD